MALFFSSLQSGFFDSTLDIIILTTHLGNNLNAGDGGVVTAMRYGLLMLLVFQCHLRGLSFWMIVIIC